ncbi:hypothetical protein [Nocardioides sp.]|uniref:hypothetical protein n=1 Tax=Nocardioides sp. TaxID=35761 RepID=UPI002D07A84B|nr:hypothetical protein [Nocardioides sp.]HSX66971.1 hypothetical protein [Nocardioides sp.]
MSNAGPQITNVDNRPWFKKPLGIAGIVGGVVLVGAIASAGGGDSDDTDKTKSDTVASTSESPKSDAPTTKEEKPATPAKKAAWKTVASLEGNTNKSGADFHLNGCDARLKYSVNGDSSTLVAFYVMESGKKLMEDGGFPVASPTESGAGETVLREDEGDYYLDVMGANATWSAQVQEKC